MVNDELLAMISTAQQELAEAEGDLDKVLSEIRAEPSAEKTGVTRAVEQAFAKLKRAKSRLAVLRDRLSASRG
jgi:hypothetical protein